MSRRPRFATWLVLGGILMGMLLTTLALIPLKEDQLLINRRTGQVFWKRSYLGIHTTTVQMAYAKTDRLAGLAGLTAPDEEVLIEGYVYRCLPFGWPASRHNTRGMQLQHAMITLFYFEPDFHTPTTLPTAEVNRLVRERLPLWNSPELDRDPQRVLTPIQTQNAALSKQSPKP